jgi:hypothetical protein
MASSSEGSCEVSPNKNIKPKQKSNVWRIEIGTPE